jgi:hypothetical protein
MFLQTTPDTSGYMIAGYAVAFITMALYVASIFLRNRNLKQDMQMLEEMERSAQKAKPKKTPAKTVTKRKAKK